MENEEKRAGEVGLANILDAFFCVGQCGPVTPARLSEHLGLTIEKMQIFLDELKKSKLVLRNPGRYESYKIDDAALQKITFVNFLRNEQRKYGVVNKSIGKKTMRGLLGLSENETDKENLEQLISELREKKIIIKGTGQGGSVKFDSSVGDNEEAIKRLFPKDFLKIFELGNSGRSSELGKKKENDLYSKIQPALEKYWKQEYPSVNKFVSQITANQGAKKTGRWSRPDIVFATYSKYEFIPGKQNFELVTVEVKLASSANETAIFETLSHRNRSLFSYLLIYRDDDNKNNEMVGRLAELAKKNKIGLFTIGDDGLSGGIENLDNWTERVSPIKNDSISAAELNQFIEEQCKEIGEETRNW